MAISQLAGASHRVALYVEFAHMQELCSLNIASLLNSVSADIMNSITRLFVLHSYPAKSTISSVQMSVKRLCLLSDHSLFLRFGDVNREQWFRLIAQSVSRVFK